MKKIFLLGLLALASCSDFNDRYANIIPGVKTRPLAVKCEPAEAAPGDTVRVTLFVYAKDPSSISFAWRAALDYRIDSYGSQQSERDIIDLTPLMFDDSVTVHGYNLVEHSFSFRIPGSVLANASSLPEEFPLTDLPAEVKTALGLDPALVSVSRSMMDSLLRTSAFDISLLPDPSLQAAVSSLVDFFTAQIRLRAEVTCDIDLEVTKQLTVRYSRAYHTANVNQNPHISWMGIIRVREELTGLESMADIGAYTNDTVTIFSDSAALTADSVIIDTGSSYFVAVQHDSQTYVSPAGGTYYEEHFCDWLYSNLDPSDLSQDSLLIITGGYELSLLLPPVDTGMRDFLIYVVLRDFRPEWGSLSSTGIDYAWAEGRFYYTPAYRQKYQHLQD